MHYLLTAILLLFLTSCSGPNGSKPLNAEQALKSFKLSDDFRVELFASEPMVVDPVDMVFDEHGRAFVADMLDLPWDPPSGKPARSRIVMLEDTDGDGKADKKTIFADNVLQVSGLIVWNGGLIVPAAPNIYWMKDTNGDGVADVREVLFTGFFQGNPEAQITNPRYALDNWIYFSNTGNAGRITSPKWPQHPTLEVRGMDFRFHPLRNAAEPSSGGAQYGLTFDDWGNRFISQNTTHLRHVVVQNKYLMRAPLLEIGSVNHDPYGKTERLMYPITHPEAWRVERTKVRQQRYDDLKTGRVEHLAGHITGAAGSTVYTGDAWPSEYRGSIFTGDVSGNLVRRDLLTPDGVTFRARPAKEGVEFLASSDNWFRPACFANAPDGNLYMMDMYRQTIETPLSIPEDIQKRLSLDFYRGDDMGRIYRLVPNSSRQKRSLKSTLGKASPQELARTLEHENGWHRMTAQRLLVERQERVVVPQLREMARKSLPLGRLHALWTLEGLGVLEEDDVLAALADENAGIREHGIRLIESLRAITPRIEKALIAKSKDSEIRVRYQAAYTLGYSKSPEARSAIISLAAVEGGDPWIRVATMSSAADWPADFFAGLMRSSSKAWQTRDLLRAVGSLAGTRRQAAEINRMLSDATRLSDPAHLLDGLARGLELSRGAPLPGVTLDAFLNSKNEMVQRAAWGVARSVNSPILFARAAKEGFDERVSIQTRAAMIAALRGAGFEQSFPVLKKVLGSAPPVQLQVAAIDALSSYRHREAAAAILEGWRGYAPDARVKAASAMLGQRDRVPLLLEALEKGTVDPAGIEVNARNRLLEDKEHTARAKKIFASAASDRDAVVANYRSALDLTGDVARGKTIFEENCAKCHAARRQGGRVGPDLRGVNNKSKEELLEAILNPSRSIEPRFVNYVVTAKDGQMYDGILANETPGAITLRGGEEEDVTILRSNVQEIRSSSISLMPEDLEKSINSQAMADVIAFLRAGI